MFQVKFNEQDKEECYDSLDKSIDQVLKHDLKIIMHNFNTKIGKNESIRSVKE